jgi:RNA polymerase sigma factor (sigma-70 family)
MPDDSELLREYLEKDCQEAFQTLVQRHVRLVYSTAQRLLNNAELAEEVTQTVFMILATKGRKLRGALLAGWLHRTARFVALQALRVERRRRRREETFAALAIGEDRELAGFGANLDEALNKLGEIDRNAIILRFLEEKGLREVGEALGISEDAARMRVNRAVTKLQASFGKSGVAVSSATLVSALSSASAVQVPSSMVSSVVATVGIKGSGIAAATTPFLVKETLKGMALAKIKTASAVAAIVVVLAVMTALVTNNKAAGREPTLPEIWQVRGSSSYSIPGTTNKAVTVQGTNGPVMWIDANDFSITVTKRNWRMLLQHVLRDLPASSTHLGDDGTNYIIFVPGARGTSRIGGQLARYEDTASVHKSGSVYPRHHGLAVWLLFASNGTMTNAAGDIGDVLGIPNGGVKYAYERLDDPAKNSFGPSMVRIFAKVGPPETRRNVLATEVEVLESQRKDGYSIPVRAEYRSVSQRPGEKAVKVWSIYQLSNISLVRNPPVSPWPPPIVRPTSISDFRHHLYRFEYVSSKWATEEEALQLMRSNKVHMYGPE